MKLPKTTITGNLGSDAKAFKGEKSGEEFVILSMALNRSVYSIEEKKYIEMSPLWYDVICFGSLADRASGLKSGQLVQVSGELRPYETETKSGDKVTTLKVIGKDIVKVERLPKASLSHDISSEKDMTEIASKHFNVQEEVSQ